LRAAGVVAILDVSRARMLLQSAGRHDRPLISEWLELKPNRMLLAESGFDVASADAAFMREVYL